MFMCSTLTHTQKITLRPAPESFHTQMVSLVLVQTTIRLQSHCCPGVTVSDHHVWRHTYTEWILRLYANWIYSHKHFNSE